ncbi:hypothetical protein [Streptomyces sp. NPDC059861]|uniref:hypothetical protein n=1 Tax=Streptomyces sp. NPDC059861 TaxID=3346974 RepID=UPI00364F412C
MIQTLPLALPGMLVDTHRIDLTMHSQGWSMDAQDVVAAPGGDVYALYHVNRYVWDTADDEADPAVADFAYWVINRYSPDGEAVASAPACATHGDTDISAVAKGDDMTLCVLPDGTLTVNATPDCTTLVTPDLRSVLATYDSQDQRPFEEFTPGGGFAGSIGVTPSGRLLCSASEYGVWGYGSSITNLVGVADGPLTPTERPSIEAIASLDPAPARHSDRDLKAHVRHQGSPVGRDHRPRPSLTELAAGEDRLSGWHDSRLGRPVPLADDLFVAPFSPGPSVAAVAASRSSSLSSTIRARWLDVSKVWTHTATVPLPASASPSRPTRAAAGSTT